MDGWWHTGVMVYLSLIIITIVIISSSSANSSGLGGENIVYIKLSIFL